VSRMVGKHANTTSEGYLIPYPFRPTHCPIFEADADDIEYIGSCVCLLQMNLR
jgi:hypothetical protein